MGRSFRCNSIVQDLIVRGYHLCFRGLVIRRVFTDVLSKVKEETVCALPTSPYNTIMVLRFRNFRVRDQSKEVQLRTSGPNYCVSNNIDQAKMHGHVEFSLVHNSGGSGPQWYERLLVQWQDSQRDTSMILMCVSLLGQRERAFSNNMPFRFPFGHPSSLSLDN
jgi:hypothetical protein